MQESKINIDVNTMVDMAITELDKILDEAKKYVLANEMFMQYIVQFQKYAANLISIMSNPAIRVNDVRGKVHFMVAGEKWKLFMAAQFFYAPDGNEGTKFISCTNPISYKYDTFLVSKNDAIKALNDYEEVYDMSIQTVMDINDKVASLANMTSNSDKLNVLREVVVMIRNGIETNRSVYKTAMTGH